MSVDSYHVLIGCEIHCQLTTKTKAFCACENRYGGMPDTRVCPVCLGLPGAMPTVNKAYVEMGVIAGTALNCSIARFTKFDRKHYFYPDLTKGYQITQYDIPLCTDGYVDIPYRHLSADLQPGGKRYYDKTFAGENSNINDLYKRVRIERIHLEEDVGKSLHLEGAHSYVDFNRCGTPLIEIVTKPDMNSPEEAALFMQTVQEILRYVDITKGNLEEGNMRCDANVNLTIRENGKEYRTPISEIKNLNSFRSIKDACAYEIKRQLKEFETNRQQFDAGFKNTMGWDDIKNKTLIQRTKNSFVDYRFVVEPDIKPFNLSEEFIRSAAEKVGELPEAKRNRLKKEYGLSSFDAETLTSNRSLALWFEQAAKLSKDVKKTANWILAEVLAVLNQKGTQIENLNIGPEHIASLVNAVSDKRITGKQAKEVFVLMIESGCMPDQIIKEKGLQVVSDTGKIAGLVNEIIVQNPQAIAEYKNGKTNVFGWLMGQIIKKSGGKANPAAAADLLKAELEKF